MIKVKMLAVVGCVQLLACSASVPEGTPSVTTTTSTGSSLTSAQVGSTSLPGYVHTVNKSKFVLGTTTGTKSEFGMDKVVGSEGVFVTMSVSQMVFGIPNATSAALALPMFSGSAADHNAAVRAYFVGAGLPESQISSVSVQDGMLGGGPTAAGSIRSTLAYYFSTVNRQANGVAVPDSFAWARLNVNGDVVHESVYWPELPASVVAEAANFAAILNNASGRGTLIASLPSDVTTTTGVLVIHHTPGEWTGSFGAWVSYDIQQSGGRTRHFDHNGVEMFFPHEQPGAWGPSQATPRRHP